ncbi:MAG: porin family protein [Pseudomonadota bacterium]|nr:porin family protein [Pseudomonadota bacterium]
MYFGEQCRCSKIPPPRFLSTVLVATLAYSCMFYAQTANAQLFVRGEVGRYHVSSRDGLGHLKDNSFVLRGGYMFTPNIGVEGLYGRYYSKSYKFAGFDYNHDLDGYGIGAVGKVRFGDQSANTGFFGMGRVGYMCSSARTSSRINIDGVRIYRSRTTYVHQPYFGIGAGYDFTPNMGVSVNYDYFRNDETRLPSTGEKLRYSHRTLAAGFEYRF